MFDPTLQSLRQHRAPAWFEDAKLGIFIHWGLFSVPAFAPRSGPIDALTRTRFDDAIAHTPYAEWYWNSIKIPGSPAAQWHLRTYGPAGRYEDFRAAFTEGVTRWDPDAWADLFAAAGARYVVMDTKHHDGFLLWPSQTRNPRRADWCLTRDVIGELAAAVRARGMKFGVYYSGGLDWTFEPAPIRNIGEMAASIPSDLAYRAYVDAHYRELIARYQPSVLWNDIAYPPGPPLWPLIADYYNAVPDGVINDRWLQAGLVNRLLRWRLPRLAFNALARRQMQSGAPFIPPRPRHCDFRTPEYASFPDIRQQKWEATRGIGHSFGYNRNEMEEDRISSDELIRSFIDGVAKNGNLLLNVGPMADGTIPEEQSQRLRTLGAWLAVSGEAIYGTRPWTHAVGETAEGLAVRFTAKPGVLYALVLGAGRGQAVTLKDLDTLDSADITLLGHGRVEWSQQRGTVTVTLPAALSTAPAHALKIAAGAR